ncbi:hypothetical protein ACIPW4_13740 [Pseudomonas sp. NPDC089996]|uniref:hypothetical protein n=1 Tax=Pseudomonas sp. NPDC089996 TaxID=3364474 RepID=UPI003809B522
MSIKAAAPALIVAALALVGDYSTLSRQGGFAQVREASAAPSGLSDLSGVIGLITQGWLELDSIYAKNVVTLVSADAFDNAKYVKNIELLKAVRQLESDLKGASVPTALQNEHLGLRRAVARVRTRMVAIDSFYQQFLVKPAEFQSELSGEALRDLADHTSDKVRHLG